MTSGVMVTPQGSPDRAAPMAAAPFVWRDDGRPNWRVMWESFCDLALHGGPPHRGVEQALRGPLTADAEAASDPGIVAEIQRGIRETTGLAAEAVSSGWISIACDSPPMAAWLGAAIALENVEARVEGDRLLLPAGPRFRLEDEVKSIITVVAKTHHYWAMHGGGVAKGMPRPLKLGIGGPGDGKTALIDALRRRYGRRRAILATPGQASAVKDHAVDLVLVEMGDEMNAAGVERETVDATIGVLDASALADALRRDDRGLDGWHLLVVSAATTAKRDLARLEADARGRRGEHPLVFIDLSTAQGIDVIVAWLGREWHLLPWRPRHGVASAT